MKINIFGSTGIIGKKTLNILNKFFPSIKINLLVANNNYQSILNQIKKYKPNYVYLNNQKYNKKLFNQLKNSSTKVLNLNELNNYLDQSSSDLTLLSISGYNSLLYFEQIIKNTKCIGAVSKECIVSAGHLFKDLIKQNGIEFFPLDSEHFSLFNYFKNNKKYSYNKIFLTASGGPFLNKDPLEYKKITFKQAIKHPKWKMGYKNSIDSATIANKCLEIIEARYLFNIPFQKLDILVHPESLVHSIIEFQNYTSCFNYFYNDMAIPIFNFLNVNSKKNNYFKKDKFLFKNNFNLSFKKIKFKQFPIYKTFLKIDKEKPQNLIKFNCSNEIAVELFRINLIRFDQIDKFINKCLLINIDYPVNNIKNIIKYQKICLEKFSEIKI